MAKSVDRKSGKSRPSIAERAAIAIKQAGAHARGETVSGTLVHEPVDVAALRKRTGLTQPEFAARFGLSVGTLRDWEQGRKTPERTAQLLLRVIAREPEAVERALRESA